MIRLSCCYLLLLFVVTSSAYNNTTTDQPASSSISSSGNISDFLEIMETPPPIMDVEEGESLKLFLLFALKTLAILANNDFILSMRKDSEMKQLYKCQGVKGGTEEERNLDCYCCACDDGDSRLLSDHRIYEMRRNKQTRLEMMVLQMEEGDNGTVYTLTMAEQTIYETEVRCTKASTAPQTNHQVIAIVVALSLLVGIACVVCCIWKGKSTNTTRVSDEEEKPPAYTTEKVVLRGPRDLHQQSRGVKHQQL